MDHESDRGDEMAKIEEFFKNFKEPCNLKDVSERVEKFINTQDEIPIVLITVSINQQN